MDNNKREYYQNEINAKIAEYRDFIGGEPEEIEIKLKNPSVFDGLLAYIGDQTFNNRSFKTNGYGIKTNVEYRDLELLDYLFNYYYLLASKYGQRKTMQGFYCMINSSPVFLANLVKPQIVNSENEESLGSEYKMRLRSLLDKWKNMCEQSLLSGDKIKDMFLLKTSFGYIEEKPVQATEEEKNTVDIPALMDTYSGIMLEDKRKHEQS